MQTLSEIMPRDHSCTYYLSMFSDSQCNGLCTAVSKYCHFLNPPTPNHNIPNQSTDNDIALLKLEKELDFNERVQPACLPYEPYYQPLNTAYASGWGANEFGGEQILFLM